MSKLDSVLKDIAKKYGQGSAQFYGDMDKVDVLRISTGLPSLDLILGGGLPEGRIIEIFGPASSGKTSLAIKFLAEVQKKYPEKRVAFIDIEHALDPDYARALGLNMDDVILSQPDSAEQALGIVEALAESGEVKAIIIDSVAKLTPRKELEGEIGDSEMAMRARLMSQGLRKITPKAHSNLCTCFFINQTRSNIGGYGNPETRPGGSALTFDASVIIRTSSKQIDENTGITTMAIKKNKVGKPFRTTEVRIKYGSGYDYVQDLVTTAKELGIVTRAGAYYSFGENRWQGEEKMREDITSNAKLQTQIEELIRKSGNKEVSVLKLEPDTNSTQLDAQ